MQKECRVALSVTIPASVKHALLQMSVVLHDVYMYGHVWMGEAQ